MQALACAVPVAISVLATRSSSGIPQIAEVMGQTKSKTPSQVATKWGPRVFFGDAVVYMSRFIYHMRRGYPLACWSELIPLMLQNVICFYLTRSRGFETDETNGEKEGEKLHCHHRHPIPPLATATRSLHATATPLPSLLQHPCRCLTLAASPAVSLWLPRHRRCAGEAVGAPSGPMAQARAGRGLPRGAGAAHAPPADAADAAPLSLVRAALDLIVHGAGARDGPHPCRNQGPVWPGCQRRPSG